MKDKNTLVRIIITIVVAAIILGLAYYLLNNKTKPTEKVSSSSSDEVSSEVVNPQKEEVENFLISFAKDYYEELELDDTVVIVNLKDMEKHYKVNTKKYTQKPYSCSDEHTYIKITIEENKKTYDPIIFCESFLED